MTPLHSIYILFLLLSFLCISICGKQELESGKKQNFHSSSSNGNRKPENLVRKLDESTEPVTNPANFAPYTPTPAVVTVPASNPTTPVDSLPTTPPTTTVPATATPTTPITNPANSGNVPVMNPNPPNQPTNSAPVSQGQTWCVAKSGASETSLQDALDYACGIGGADCSTIQEGGSCYNPISLQSHASYAFNSYFQKNPAPTSCDFGGTASLVNTNPSSGSCIYPSSATGTGTAAPAMPSSTAPPTTGTPSSVLPTPGSTSSTGTFGSSDGSPTSGNYGSPPSLTNPSNPNSLFPASYGPDSSSTGNSYSAGSAALQPNTSLIILVAFFFTGKLILGK